jgi:hypothetical protein
MPGYDSTELLFCKYDMFRVLESQKQSMIVHVSKLPESHLLSASNDALVDEIFARFELTIPHLNESEISVSSPHEVQIDVSRDFRFGYGAQSIKGTEVVFNVPYIGEVEFFRLRPTRFNLNPPRAIVKAGELGFPFRQVELDAEQIRREFDGQIKSVKEFLVWQTNDVKPFNDNLKNNALQALVQRRDKLRHAQAAVSSLGFPMRE